jgi:hypothetical protein
MGLRRRLDRLGGRADQAARLDTFDAFQGQAWNVLTGAKARRAFDLRPICHPRLQVRPSED